jgi:hypothetical protein
MSVLYTDVLEGPTGFITVKIVYSRQHIESLCDFAEYSLFTIEVVEIFPSQRNKKLRAVGVWACVDHTNKTQLVVLTVRNNLILEGHGL